MRSDACQSQSVTKKVRLFCPFGVIESDHTIERTFVRCDHAGRDDAAGWSSNRDSDVFRVRFIVVILELQYLTSVGSETHISDFASTEFYDGTGRSISDVSERNKYDAPTWRPPGGLLGI